MATSSLSGANLEINWEKSKFSPNYFHFTDEKWVLLQKNRGKRVESEKICVTLHDNLETIVYY